MTRKVFWEDPYLTEMEALVTAVTQEQVTLDRTILYAESGGQESDRGSIAGFPVIAAQKDGGTIVYTLPGTHTVKVGDRVRVRIDWPRRYRLMRLHFAAELVLELTYRASPGIEKIGAHIGEEKARIDFLWAEDLTARMPFIQHQAGQIIQANHVVESTFTDRATETRQWRIEGFAQVACGGTHIRTTGEIGVIALSRKKLGRDKQRVEIRLVSP